MFCKSFLSVLFLKIINLLYSTAEYTDEWRIIEALAEENPYVVGLLNSTLDYICSGTTIGSRTVLTSGYCVSSEPTHVAVGLAVLNKKMLPNLLEVAYTLVHSDYSYLMNTSEPNLTLMHSNMGLVFVMKPILDQFLPTATVGSYFASELSDIELTNIGYGRRQVDDQDDQNLYVLQYQCYDQSPCLNPRWYYCICGTEIATVSPTHGKNFGNGAPILYGTDVVCISAISTEAQVLKSSELKFNIFTVIGAYIPWIEKTDSYMLEKPRLRSRESANKGERHFNQERAMYTVFMFLIVR